MSTTSLGLNPLSLPCVVCEACLAPSDRSTIEVESLPRCPHLQYQRQYTSTSLMIDREDDLSIQRKETCLPYANGCLRAPRTDYLIVQVMAFLLSDSNSPILRLSLQCYTRKGLLTSALGISKMAALTQPCMPGKPLAYLSTLPVEIRIEIYEHLFKGANVLTRVSCRNGKINPLRVSKITSILQVNHRFYAEALPLFYDRMSFILRYVVAWGWRPTLSTVLFHP